MLDLQVITENTSSSNKIIHSTDGTTHLQDNEYMLSNFTFIEIINHHGLFQALTLCA